MTKRNISLILGAIVIAVGGLFWCLTIPNKTAKPQNNLEIKTPLGSFEYPNDWEIDPHPNGDVENDAFALLPLTLKNNYCDIGKETDFLISNYKRYNPFSGYEAYATKLSKEENCSIQFRIEQNPDKLSIRDYLKEKYTPLAHQPGMKENMLRAITNLNTKNISGVEQVRIDYSFERVRSGADANTLDAILYDQNFAHQFIVNAHGQMLFITNHIQDDLTGNGLFDKIIKSFHAL